MKMADTSVEACIGAAQLIHDNTVITEHKCAYCSELERKLKDVLEDLSSMQLVIKLLQEESTHNEPCNTCRPIHQFNECNEWTRVTHNHHGKSSKSDNNDNSQLVQIISTKNRYDLLTNLPKNEGSDDVMITSQVVANKDSVKESSAQFSEISMKFSCKRLQDNLCTKEVQRAASINHQTSTLNQRQDGTQPVENNFHNQKLLQFIPTIVNGRVIPNVHNKRVCHYNSYDIKPCGLVTETLSNVKLNCCKKAHKVIMMGDSFFRGSEVVLMILISVSLKQFSN
jgi:hypothetical protein